MPLQCLVMDYHFPCSPEVLFERLTDHEQFGKLIGQSIKRIQDGPESTPNGVGSVRRIHLAPGISFDETVVDYEAPRRMVYRVSRGSPIKNHRGELLFHATDDGTRLVYRIEFAPKLPGTGWLLGKLIRGPLDKGLRKLQTALATG
ncbi:SRPBCC family protein [Simiduia aestuariiviva]|uniref:Uncharacterized protein YndB with AHSA1/START domain n=1 Tax=Simiduia aestuariiviva TaxID=1510459 RepID=A0A839UHH3_9GAMM|nr:SRPBCC family protein [Simiduia aestuariiviva]MBB3167312.1 uncharacterized protein YndB with AHSA1/START domain [Simiduia aestuariiviva]